MKKTKLILPIVASTAVVATLPIALTSCGADVYMDCTKSGTTWTAIRQQNIKSKNTYIYKLLNSETVTGIMAISALDDNGGYVLAKSLKVNGNDTEIKTLTDKSMYFIIPQHTEILTLTIKFEGNLNGANINFVK